MSLQNAYGRLWDDLMREGRGLRSTVLGELLWTTQTRLIQQYANGVGRVLDLGAGHLSYREQFQGLGLSYLSMDIVPTHPELNFLGDGERLPFKADSFELVFSSQVLEHTPHPSAMFSEAVRVLKKGGTLLLFAPFMYYVHGEPHDYHRFSLYALHLYAQENDLHIVESGRIGGLVAFWGMNVQNIFLLLTYRLPLLGEVAWGFNRLITRLLVALDKPFGMGGKFPILVYLIARKG